MSLSYYMDVQVPFAITRALRLRRVTVLTAQEDGTGTLDDPKLLDRATALGYVLFTQDVDFLAEATRRQRAGESFGGVIFGRQQPRWIGRYIDDLEVLAKACEATEFLNRVEYLPL